MLLHHDLLLVLVRSSRDVPLGHRLEEDVVLTAMDAPMGHLRDTDPVLTARDVPLGHRCARLLGPSTALLLANFEERSRTAWTCAAADFEEPSRRTWT